MDKFEDLSNRQFGSWRTTNISKCVDGRHMNWQCICVCGVVKFVRSDLLKSGMSSNCRKCNGKKTAKRFYTGCEELSGVYFNTLRKNAELRKLDFDLTIEYLYELFVSQDKKCALSGVSIYLNRSLGSAKIDEFGVRQSASVDRIDPSIGYVMGNVQWVHSTVNYMKTDLIEEEFIEWCRKIVTKWGDAK